MNTLFRTIFATVLVSGFFTVVSLLLPSSITTSMTSSLSFFLGYINYLSPLVHVDVLFSVIRTLANVFVAFFVVVIFKWVLHLFVG